GEEVGGGVDVLAEDAGEDVGEGVVARGLGGDAPGVDLALDPGVVARERLETPPAEAVEAAVADVADPAAPRALHDAGGEGGAHAAGGRVAGAAAGDGVVRGAHGRLERGEEELARDAAVHGADEQGGGGGGGELAGD